MVKRSLLRSLLTPGWVMRRRFTPAVLAEIEETIARAERHHAGEICFAVEHALDLADLRSGLTPRDRALEVFGLMRVWDTEGNNGVLVYVLYAERAVEIVADRGIAKRVPQADWETICRAVEQDFHAGAFREGSLKAVSEIARLLERHFPDAGGDGNELPDQPLLL
jgi:uncharacterized membrane protein